MTKGLPEPTLRSIGRLTEFVKSLSLGPHDFVLAIAASYGDWGTFDIAREEFLLELKIVLVEARQNARLRERTIPSRPTPDEAGDD